MSDVNVNEHDDTTPELSPVEEKALARGWRPQEEFEGDADEWVDAKEFVARGELMDTIHNKSREIKSLRSELDTVKGSVAEVRDHYEKLAEAQVKEKIKELRQAKREAMRLDDLEAADEIDDQLSSIQEEKRRIDKAKEESANTTTSEVPPEVQQWISNNPWADQTSDKFDQVLAEEAMALVQVEVTRTGDRSIASLNRVKDKLSKLYPEKFGTKSRPATSVDSTDTSTRGNSSTGKLARKLDADQRKIGEKFVKSGAVKNLEEYAKQLNDMGAL